PLPRRPPARSPRTRPTPTTTTRTTTRRRQTPSPHGRELSMPTKEDILESIANMTVLERSELLKDFEEKFGVTAAAPAAVAAPAPAGGGGGAAEAEEEK